MGRRDFITTLCYSATIAWQNNNNVNWNNIVSQIWSKSWDLISRKSYLAYKRCLHRWGDRNNIPGAWIQHHQFFFCFCYSAWNLNPQISKNAVISMSHMLNFTLHLPHPKYSSHWKGLQKGNQGTIIEQVRTSVTSKKTIPNLSPNSLPCSHISPNHLQGSDHRRPSRYSPEASDDKDESHENCRGSLDEYWRLGVLFNSI